MNTNPSAKRILVYGDSNTWGASPESGERYGIDERYPGILQKALGDDHEVIEEGLCGRTICASSEYEESKGRNGYTYLTPCISSHVPLDLLVINLGTNEYKQKFGLSAQDVAGNLQKLCDLIRDVQKDREENFKVLILAPGYTDDSKIGEAFDGEFKNTESKSKQIAPLFKEVADKNGFEFLDIAPVATPGEDGVHYTIESHKEIAELLAKKVKEIIG